MDPNVIYFSVVVVESDPAKFNQITDASSVNTSPSRRVTVVGSGNGAPDWLTFSETYDVNAWGKVKVTSGIRN